MQGQMSPRADRYIEKKNISKEHVILHVRADTLLTSQLWWTALITLTIGQCLSQQDAFLHAVHSI